MCSLCFSIRVLSGGSVFYFKKNAIFLNKTFFCKLAAIKNVKNYCMKRILFVFWAVIIGLVIFSSCNKYEEGPSFSLLSATKRIVGTWELTETTINDTVVSLNDLTSMLGDVDLDSLTGGIPISIEDITVTSVKVTFEKDGDGNFFFAISAGFFPVSRTEYITWVFDDEKVNIDITIMSEVQSFEIIRLTNKELWLRRIETTAGPTTTTVMKMEKEKE
jgi:hypothetical protein